jgi:uncharacterized damage-inducible protein DinB
MRTETQKIIRILNKTFEKGAWHGPTVMEVLSNVNEHNSNKRIGQSHSIIELIAHMTSWRRFVIEKLAGNYSYEVGENENFPVVTHWQQHLGLLHQSQQDLIKSIENLPEERLNELVPHINQRYTYYTLLHGIVHHDLYHIGQIQLIVKYGS